MYCINKKLVGSQTETRPQEKDNFHFVALKKKALTTLGVWVKKKAQGMPRPGDAPRGKQKLTNKT